DVTSFHAKYSTEVNDDLCIISFLIIELQMTSDKSFYVIYLLIFIVSRQEETRFQLISKIKIKN
ncbi:hypothetical protein, partial [Staphylococcus epidermidis]|uniref:hypothetical protein n=1 Tax=Staphylococcus epidermidis TaxID=1282 RepID=UPI00066D7228